MRGALGGHYNEGLGGGGGLRERENLDETLHARELELEETPSSPHTNDERCSKRLETETRDRQKEIGRDR